MRRSTIISFLAILIVFGFYFRLIDPMLKSNRWLAFAVFLLIWLSLRGFNQLLEKRFVFLDKRIDPQTGVLLIFVLLIFLPFLIFSLG